VRKGAPDRRCDVCGEPCRPRGDRCVLHRRDPTLTVADLARLFAEEQSWSRTAARLGLGRADMDLLRALVVRRYERAPGRAPRPPLGADVRAWERYRRAVDEWFAGLAGAPGEEAGAG
jgi:hypothetical protein